MNYKQDLDPNLESEALRCCWALKEREINRQVDRERDRDECVCVCERERERE